MAGNTWRKLVTNSSIKRSSQTIAVIGKRAFIYGGELRPREPVDSDVYTVDIESDIFDVSKIESQNVSPTPRVGSASTSLNGLVYIFSGRGGIAMAPIEEGGSFWTFNSNSRIWSQLHPANTGSPYPAGRSYHALANNGTDTIFVHAGCPEKGRLSDLWSFNIPKREWTELAPAPDPARGGTSIAFSAGKLFRMNGFDGNTEQGGAIDIYDPSKNTWDSLRYQADGVSGPSPRSVSCLLAAEIKEKPVLITMFGEHDPSALGHQGAGKMLGDVWSFDINGQTWSNITPSEGDAPPPRGWFDADIYQNASGSAIVVHGGLAESNERLDDLWMLRL